MTRPDVKIAASLAGFAEAAALYVTELACKTIRDRGMFAIALAGGETPRGIYRLLESGSMKGRIDWSRVHVFFGDERMVPPDDPQSNYGMVRAELIRRVPIPGKNVHRILGERHVDEAVHLYADELRHFFEDDAPRFDLTVLGVGVEGHVASLFPGTDALKEMVKSVTSSYVPDLKSWRVSLTLPVINTSRQILFLVSGKSKASIVRTVLTSTTPSFDIPASLVRPADGHLHWILDSEAGALLPVEMR